MTDGEAYQWVASCLKKNRYDSEDKAIRTKKKVYKKRRVRLRAYYYSHCDGYHLTKKI